MTIRLIETPGAPRPAGHYSQAVVHGGLVYLAGQLPIDPSGPPGAPGRALSPGEAEAGAEAQTERALRNVEAILRAAGTDLGHLLTVTLYVSDISLWPRVNAAYSRVLGEHRPARAVVPVKELHHGYLVEIQAVAALP